MENHYPDCDGVSKRKRLSELSVFKDEWRMAHMQLLFRKILFCRTFSWRSNLPLTINLFYSFEWNSFSSLQRCFRPSWQRSVKAMVILPLDHPLKILHFYTAYLRYTITNSIYQSGIHWMWIDPIVRIALHCLYPVWEDLPVRYKCTIINSSSFEYTLTNNIERTEKGKCCEPRFETNIFTCLIFASYFYSSIVYHFKGGDVRG